MQGPQVQQRASLAMTSGKMDSAISLHQAAADNFVHLLRHASKKQANSPDEEGLTPVHYAAYFGHLESLRLLIGRGGDPDLADSAGNTALHLAVANGHLEAVSFLVNFGVNLWALTNDRKTARDISVDQETILQMLDNEMAHQAMYNERKVKKLKEKSLMQLEKRLKALAKLQQKSEKKTASIINKSTLEDLEMRLEQLLALPKTSVSPSNSVTSSVTHSSIASKFSDLVFPPNHIKHNNNNNNSNSITNTSNAEKKSNSTSANSTSTNNTCNNSRNSSGCIYSRGPRPRRASALLPLRHHRSMGSLSSCDGRRTEESVHSVHSVRGDKWTSSVSSIHGFVPNVRLAPSGPEGERGRRSVAPSLRFKASPWLHVFHD